MEIKVDAQFGEEMKQLAIIYEFMASGAKQIHEQICNAIKQKYPELSEVDWAYNYEEMTIVPRSERKLMERKVIMSINV